MSVKEDDVLKNKSALIDEMGNSLATANEFINDAIEQTEGGKPEALLSSMIGMAHQIGYLSAVFNQYVVFERGMPAGEQKIGFRSMLHKDD